MIWLGRVAYRDSRQYSILGVADDKGEATALLTLSRLATLGIPVATDRRVSSL